MNKVIDYYKQSPGSGKQLILDFVTFFEEQKMVGKHLTAYIKPFNHFQLPLSPLKSMSW